MPENEPQEQSRKTRKKNSSRPTFFLVAIILLAATAAGIFLYTRSHQPPPPVSISQSDSQPAPPDPLLEQPNREKVERPEEPPPIPAEHEAAQPDTASLPVEGQHEACGAPARKLHEFFRYLDQQEYPARSSLNGSSQAHFIDMAKRLLANPPVVSRETDDLYTILQNTAHFFRVIGKDNILLVKNILEREKDKIEEVAGDLYQWLITEGCREELLPFSPPLAEVYEYAGFFLNTIGGRSYLFRRDSRTRLLINYYSILIVDRANALGVNRHGIDLRQPVSLLIQEIESSTLLLRKESYLERLYQLQDTLPMRPGETE
ncbi:MAG: hypothetical protein C4563_06245 [Desulfobulbus sp.]|nr:MAG: hypothetical protein C4563_06245 [Desulfobulbus sp.]